MARNRKRAKDRRGERPPAGPGGASRRGVAATRPNRQPDARPNRNGADGADGVAGVDGLEAELAAQQAELEAEQAELEREITGQAGADPAGIAGAAGAAGIDPSADPRSDEDELPAPLEHATPDAEIADAQIALGAAAADQPAADGGDEGRPPRGRRSAEGDDGEPDDEELAVTTAPQRAAGPRQPLPGRLAGFLQGSWRELQRVQWPDRRQVMQATGVVIGFVVVAGVFLGLSDYVAQRIVNLILK